MVRSGLLSAVTVATIWARLANGQSSTVAADCNPLSSSNCSPNKALATTFAEDFSSESDRFESQNDSGEIKYGSDGLEMVLKERYDNPGLKSNFYLMYGKVEAVLKAGPGRGIVSSFFLQSDDLDELDLEWIGSDDTQFQSNYFSKGNVETYDRGEFHGVNQPQAEFHNYTIDWAMDKTVWYLDGQPVRTLENTTSQGYPQSPMFVKMGIWAGGDPSNEPGTIEWAGGSVDYSQAPFSMYIKEIIVTDYSTGSEYSYGDQSGSWQSIEAKDGSVYGRYDEAQKEFAALANGDEISSSSSSASSSSSRSSATSSSSSTSSSASSTSSSSTSSSVSSTSSSSTSESIASSQTPSSTSEKSSTTSSTSSEKSSSTTEASSTSSEKSSSTTETSSASSEKSSSSTEASSTSSEKTSSSTEVSSTTSEPASSSETTETSPSQTPTSTKDSEATTSIETPSTLTTGTTSAQESSESSSATVQQSNNAAGVGYSHGLTGLLGGLALALVY